MTDPIFEGIDPEQLLFPDGIGGLLRNLLAEPEWQPSGPYVHTFREPAPVPLLDDDGLPVLDEAGEPVTFVPSRPSYGISHYWEPTPEQAVEMICIDDGMLLGGCSREWADDQIGRMSFPLDTAAQRVARILTDAGWTAATLGAVTGNRRWVTDDCPPDCAYTAVEHWHGWFCDTPYVAGPDGILEQPDFTDVAVRVAPWATPAKKKRGKR